MDIALADEEVVAGGFYSLTGTAERPVEIRTDWAAPYWIDLDSDGNLEDNKTTAPAKAGTYTVEVWQVSAADDKADGGYPYTEAVEAVDAIPARDPDPEHPDFNNADNQIDGSHPGTPAVKAVKGVAASKKLGTVEVKVKKAD